MTRNCSYSRDTRHDRVSRSDNHAGHSGRSDRSDSRDIRDGRKQALEFLERTISHKIAKPNKKRRPSSDESPGLRSTSKDLRPSEDVSFETKAIRVEHDDHKPLDITISGRPLSWCASVMCKAPNRGRREFESTNKYGTVSRHRLCHDCRVHLGLN